MALSLGLMCEDSWTRTLRAGCPNWTQWTQCSHAQSLSRLSFQVPSWSMYLVTQCNPSLGDLSGEAGWPSTSLSLGLLARQIRGSRRPLNAQKWQDPYSNQGSVVQNANYSYGASLLSRRVKTLRMNWANPNLDYNWGNSAFTRDGTRIHSGFREDGGRWLWVRREWFVTIHFLKPSLRASSQESKVCSLYFHISYVINDNKIK